MTHELQCFSHIKQQIAWIFVNNLRLLLRDCFYCLKHFIIIYLTLCFLKRERNCGNENIHGFKMKVRTDLCVIRNQSNLNTIIVNIFVYIFSFIFCLIYIKPDCKPLLYGPCCHGAHKLDFVRTFFLEH